jgi:hypothetical protein
VTVWWVNQGDRYFAERPDGFFWAQERDKDGIPSCALGGSWPGMEGEYGLALKRR